MNACLTYTVKHIQKGLTLLGDDIRLHFQGSTVDAKGKAKMNPSSADETYTSLLASLRSAMKRLAKQIEPKVYEYGFLKK